MSGFVTLVGLRYAGTSGRGQLLAFLSRMSMLGLITGVALLVLVMSVMNGFDREMRERILNLVPHLSVYHGSGAIEDWEAAMQQVSGLPHVTAVAPFVEVQAMIKAGTQMAPVMMLGVDAQHLQQVSDFGDFIPRDEYRNWSSNKSGVMLGVSLAQQLGVQKGDRIVTVLRPGRQSMQGEDALAIQTFTVMSLVESQTELDNALVLSHLDTMIQSLRLPGPQGLRIQLDDLFEAQQVQWQLLKILPAGHYTRSWSQTHGYLYEAIQMSRALVSLLMFIIIAVAAFNVVSSLIMVVFEKKQAIAILRSQGASRKHIVRIFMLQGLVIGMIGSGIGIVTGCVLAWLAPDFVNLLEGVTGIDFLRTEIYPISYIPSDIRLVNVAGVFFVAVFFSFVAALFPAWKASRVEPARVLRYE
jgi:lipoprotein-releasing system permease protein